MAINYSDVCSKASGIFVRRGFAKLGPVRDISSLLLRTDNGDPGALMAAEQIAHFVEGWRYASSAISAYLNNSKDGAVHFAYYAELRASLSLLAWSGIRVRQGDYWYLNVHGAKVPLGSDRTHTAVWKFWEDWVNRPDAKDLLLKKVKITPSVNLGHIVDAVAFVDPSIQLGGWGRDLIAVARDHDSRNASSYQADIAGRVLTRLGDHERGLVAELWGLLAPAIVGARFDSALAHHIVACALGGVEGDDEAEDSVSDRFEKIVSKVSVVTGEKAETISNVLRGGGLERNSIFAFASSVDVGAENILCRAFCLLRIAMLALDSSLRESGKPEASGWIRNWLDHAGIWSDELECDPADIAEDYEMALNDFLGERFSGALWKASNLESVLRITRPDACLAWNLSL